MCSVPCSLYTGLAIVNEPQKGFEDLQTRKRENSGTANPDPNTRRSPSPPHITPMQKLSSTLRVRSGHGMTTCARAEPRGGQVQANNQAVRRRLGGAAAAAMISLSGALALPALAGSSSIVSEFKTSGVVFKDSVQVLQLRDPEVQVRSTGFIDRSIAPTLSLALRALLFTRGSRSITRTTLVPSRKSSPARKTPSLTRLSRPSLALSAVRPRSRRGTPPTSRRKRERRYSRN